MCVLAACVDIKTELKVASLVAIVCLIFMLVMSPGDGKQGSQPEAGNTLAFLLFLISTAFPVFRSYILPPAVADVPDECSSVIKLISFPAGFKSFEAHLASEFSVENIIFWDRASLFQVCGVRACACMCACVRVCICVRACV